MAVAVTSPSAQTRVSLFSCVATVMPLAVFAAVASTAVLSPSSPAAPSTATVFFDEAPTMLVSTPYAEKSAEATTAPFTVTSFAPPFAVTDTPVAVSPDLAVTPPVATVLLPLC